MNMRNRLLVVAGLLASVIPLTGRSAVVINEVQSSNDLTPVTDDVGEAMDWVELYNSGDAAVDLAGWGLSDNAAKKPFKWTFPAGASIPAHGYLVVICDKAAKSTKYPVENEFSLGADGETLTLTSADSQWCDEVVFGRIPCDCSFGRVQNGDTFKWFAEPTPGAANDRTAYEKPLGPVTFSRERGVFTGSTSFSVELSHDDPEATIHYTTDHGDPSASSTKYAGAAIRVSGTTIIRATAVKEGHLPCRNITTHSYIYLDQVVNQVKPACAQDTWSDIAKTEEDKWIEGGRTGDPETLGQGKCTASYGVSTKSVLTGPAEKAQFVEALQAAPIVSITLSDMDLFNNDKSKGAYGVYAKPVLLDGREDGKRAASVEWVTGNHVFCTDAGLSAHGDASRHFDYSPKKSLGLKFRGRFGANKLEVPVFDNVGYDGAEFKSLVLRAESNNSWTHVDSPSLGTSMHDQFLRDVSGAMTGFQSHGNHVHLFINGLYWGLYNLCEAMDDHFAAALMGGENEQYDVFSGNGHEPTGITVNDGSADDFNALMDRLRALKDKKDNGRELYETACAEVNIDWLIDYMLIEWYCGNTDWPHKNWKATLSKDLGSPLTYFAWDLDASMKDANEDRVSVDPVTKSGYKTVTNSVQYLQRWLEISPEYRLRFADHIHRHFYNDGALVAENLVARYREMAERVRPMVFAEVARWGAYRKDYEGKTLYDMSTWSNRYNSLTTSYLPKRGTYVLDQLGRQGLYPSVAAAEFTVAADRKSATLRSAPSGATVYYTTDGSDPRVAYTGAVSAGANPVVSGGTVEAMGTAPVKVRALSGGDWSALTELELVPARNTYVTGKTGGNWDDDASWTLGTYPNAADAEAAIGVPTELKKGRRNIHIDSNDISVSYLEFTNGGMTNRIDTGDNGGGDFALYGTIAVKDTGAAMIDLDPPNAIVLAAAATANVAEGGELILKGALAGGGFNLENAGAGRLTLACTTASPLGKLQCSAGIVAVETPIAVESITKKAGTVWTPLCDTNLATAVTGAMESGDAVNPNLGLFAPNTNDTVETVWYGGVVAKEAAPKSVTVYVPAKTGPVQFCGRRWKARSDAKAELLTLEDGRVTYEVTIPPPKPVTVVINEVQASNDTTLPDEHGVYSDWAELFNAGDEAVDLSGWGFSDSKSNPYKWTFPAGTTIQPGGYLIVICDGTDARGAYLHAGISLSADGETLTLTDPDGRTVDRFKFGAMPTDRSCGRRGAEDATPVYFDEPTPGKVNAEKSYDAPVMEPVVFSRERGVFTGNTTLRVTLSHPNAAATIWYTTDHSDPEPNGETSHQYAGEEIAISKTTIVRATAIVPDALPCRKITSQSYIFLDQVYQQQKPANANAPDVWCDAHYCTYCKKIVSNSVPGDRNNPCAACPASYTISSTVVKDATTRNHLVEALQAGTVLSITMSDRELFDSETGVYTHPSSLDIDRAASIEWVTGDHVFGTDCGVAMQGGWARQFEITPKKSFQLKFRARFGSGALEVPVLDDVGCGQAEFKSLILRGENNQSWGRASDKGTSMADQFIRDLQGEMSGFQSHGTHVHLFLNGLYWGVYNLCERGDANWASTATGWGGEAEDYDVLKHEDATRDDDDGANIDVRDGSADAYTNLINYVKSKASSTKLTQAVYEELASKIDIDSYIDYYMLQCYIGNQDWPNNNWVAVLSEKLGVPLRYLAWDVEYALFSTTISSPAGSGGTWTSDNVHKTLSYSSEYKLRFADRVHRHFFNDGILTTPSLRARYQKKAEHVRKMIFGEVARWGAYYPDHNGTGKTPDNWKFDVHYASSNYSTVYDEKTWETEANSITNTFFGKRWSTYKTQLSNAGLWTTDQSTTADFEVAEDRKSATLKIPSGKTVYYTTDGSDPREPFTGKPVGRQYTSGQKLVPTGAAPLKARAYQSGTWSALSEVQLVPPTNEFIPTGNGADWEVDANWTRGYYPNAAGEKAKIGVPTAVKEGKTWRNVKIGSDVMVGAVELTNGGWTNRLTGAGSLTFCGEISADGTETNDATFVVTDESGAGLAMIDLDDPAVIRLESGTTLIVSNAVETADCGGLRIEGTIIGNGHDLEKTGPGRLTLACAVTGIDKLKCAEGIVAIEKPITLTSITQNGPVWLKMDEAVVCADKLSADAVGLFVETEIGGTTAYGGAIAVNSITLDTKKKKKCTVYIPDAAGTVRFCDKNWRACDEATVEEATTDDGRKTYKVFVPYQQPLVTVGGVAFYSVQEALDAANTAKPLVFALPPVVAGSTITANGESGIVKDYYDVEQAGDTLTLKLNEKAQPETSTFSEITWFAGTMSTQKRRGFLSKPGFYYALGQDGTAKTDWIAGDGTPQFIDGEDGWEVMVSDVPPAVGLK